MIFKVSFTASLPRAEAFAALLMETFDPVPAVSVAEGGAERLVEAYFEERPDLEMLAGLLGGDGQDRQHEDGEHADGAAAHAMRLEEVPDENWVARVQRGLHPVRAGRFLIHGSHDRAAGRGLRNAIEIDAGLAFGTAHHGTTRGCLMAIDALAKRADWGRVLDLGTGSGVLAIAAARVSRAEVLATDIDPVATQVARENIAINGAAGRVRAVTAVGTASPAIRDAAPFDLITANILAGPLIRLAPGVARLAAPGGHIVLSGLLDSQAREVGATYRRLGLALERRFSLDGWTTLVLRAAGRRPQAVGD